MGDNNKLGLIRPKFIGHSYKIETISCNFCV
jgi:hypothetical protein